MSEGSGRREDNVAALAGRLICVVDDDDIFRSYLALLLKNAGMNAIELADSAGLTAYLAKTRPDCILLDYHLASENGLSIHEQLKLRFPDLPPVLMVSADEAQNTAIRAFRIGVEDFIPKRNLRPDMLMNFIQRAIERHEAAQAKDVEFARMRETSAFDDITGLYNRRQVDDRLSTFTALAAEGSWQFGVILVSFAQYEEVLSRFGVAAADAALRSFTARLKSATSNIGFCGHYDTRTFCCLIDRNVDDDALASCTRKIMAELSFGHQLQSVNLSITPVVSVALVGTSGGSGTQIAAKLDALAERHRQEVAKSRRDVAAPMALDGHQNTQDQPSTIERRRSVRIKTLKEGLIVFKDMSSTINCTVRNISDHGAKLRFDGVFVIPEHFQLRIGAGGPLRQVRRIWHLKNEVGVEFTDS